MDLVKHTVRKMLGRKKIVFFIDTQKILGFYISVVNSWWNVLKEGLEVQSTIKRSFHRDGRIFHVVSNHLPVPTVHDTINWLNNFLIDRVYKGLVPLSEEENKPPVRRRLCHCLTLGVECCFFFPLQYNPRHTWRDRIQTRSVVHLLCWLVAPKLLGNLPVFSALHHGHPADDHLKIPEDPWDIL